GTYTNENKDELALKTYDQLIKEYKDGSFTARAILRQGVIYYNKNQTAPALEKFKLVAAQYPRTSEALEAVSTARQIYVDTGRVDVYADWVKTLDYIEVSDQDLDNTSYESAEKMYFQNQ
ncbi:tetratricopeptide repeat protein, partial [Arthrospira platensis SPKY2]